jgi:hypothetical protein
VLLTVLSMLQGASHDTLQIRTVGQPPPPGQIVDSARYGPPQIRLNSTQGPALVWLLRAADTFFVAATIQDTTPAWNDDFVVSMNVRGAGGATPGHDDFQWYFRRALDSTVIYRGRGGRWEAPRGDPDWRLGKERSGGAWQVSARDDSTSWSLVLRLDPAWLEESGKGAARLAIRISDNSPRGSFAWPRPPGVSATSVEQTPALWGYLR